MAEPSQSEPQKREGSPKPNRRDFVVVGLGASAGGIKALREFFAAAAPQSGIAYVVILHMSPDHESRLAEVLQVTTEMPVTQVTRPVRIEPNHVYVIAPNKGLEIESGILALVDIAGLEARRSPVDLFFRTLAETHGLDAVCVVLSGTGHNGSNGLKHIKEHGGLSIAQEPTEAEFEDMPRNAIATGLVDCVLPVAQMPAKILAYAQQREHGEITGARAARSETEANAFREIVTLLRVRTGHDFSNYKTPTLYRRIERRVAVREAPDLASYARIIRGEPDEARALFKELLISVTNFFRDPDAFAVLERQVIPRLFENKRARDQIRVWVPGCATGEEAYSVAMLVSEAGAAASEEPAIQLFATDLDQHAIGRAREGLYTEGDVADLSEERVRRFFQRENGAYRIRRELRERVLFAHHNVVKDPPFSHLDLICCRNLLIYLNRTAQERVIHIFHFALRPGGYLFLGTSESTDAADDLFTTLHKSAHIYENRATTDRFPRSYGDKGFDVRLNATTPDRQPLQPRPPERLSAGELHHQLLEQYAPPSIVVSEDFQVVHMSQHAGAFLQFGPGEPSRELLRVLRPELRAQVRTALYQAARTRSNSEVTGVTVPTDTGEQVLDVIVRPALRPGDPPRGFFLIVFGPAQRAAVVTSQLAATDTEPMLRHLEEELSGTKEELRSTIEQYETQVEEAKASNEELQAMNEELRSAAEELETSKEELQSVNEELATVNQELKVKIEELGLTNNHLQNLINSTEIGTIFLDRSLRVRLSTPRARDIFNLQDSDAGRPLSDITSRLVNGDLIEEATRVLDQLQTIEREVRTREERWYLMRLLPYRTADNHIDGVVVTFLDTTSRHRAEEGVRASEERFRLLIDSAVDYAIFTFTIDGVIDSWNLGAQRLFGYARDEVLGSPAAILVPPEDAAAGVADDELERVKRDGRVVDERWYVRKDGTRLWCNAVTTKLEPSANSTVGFARIAQDLTSKLAVMDELQTGRNELENRVAVRTRELQLEVSDRSAAEERARSLLRKVVTAQEDERARLARDLHDQLGQQLTSLRLTLERHKEHCTAAESDREELEKAQLAAQQIDDDLDFIAWELRPPALDDLGLAVALPRYVEEWARQYNVQAKTQTAGLSNYRLSPQVEIAFYRIAQEALNNVAKHASATRVDVILERREYNVVLVIEDDGVGFDQAEPTSTHGMGLISMRERAAVIGATLEVESSPTGGTSIFLRYPLSSVNAEDVSA